jgi:plasmid stabilization system protein ParE
MKYRVVVQRLALEDLDESYLWAARHAPQTSARWLNRFQAELQTLADNPQRCSLAPENGKVWREIRQLLFGKRPNVYRAVFTIDGETVRVLRIRRAARRLLSKQELED